MAPASPSRKAAAASSPGSKFKKRAQGFLIIAAATVFFVIPNALLFIVYVGGMAGYGSGVSNDPLQASLDLMQ